MAQPAQNLVVTTEPPFQQATATVTLSDGSEHSGTVPVAVSDAVLEAGQAGLTAIVGESSGAQVVATFFDQNPYGCW